MLDQLKSLLSGDKKTSTHKKEGVTYETYTAANSDAILSQQKWLAGLEEDETDEPESPVVMNTMPDTFQQQLAERDAMIAEMLATNHIIMRTFQAELAESEGGISRLSSRVSNLEQNEAETTQMVGASFAKDAQQRLELKQAKAREKALQEEVDALKALVEVEREKAAVAAKRIAELEDGHLSSIIDSAVDDDEHARDIDRASKKDVSGVEYGGISPHNRKVSSVSTGSGGVSLGSGGVSLNNNNGMPVNRVGSPTLGIELNAGDIDRLDEDDGAKKGVAQNGGSETAKAAGGGCCVIA